MILKFAIQKNYCDNFHSSFNKVDGGLKLSVNPGKTQITKFGKNFSKYYFAFSTSVQITDVRKYLGIFDDKKLNFKFHIEQVCKKLNKFCGPLWKAGYFFSMQQLLRFDKAYLISTIYSGVLR